MSYLSRTKFNALKKLYKRYIVNKRIIQSIVFFSILIMSIAFFSTYSEAGRIGTCYAISYRPYPVCDDDFTDITAIESFRVRFSWGELEQYMTDHFPFDMDQLADSIMALMPSDPHVEKNIPF